ncbi:type ISP restriction/modification enzyme [Chloroflexota bacterium]
MPLTQADIEKLRSLTSFDALVDYLRDELDWPIETEDAEEITFDYDSEELGIDSVHAVNIETIKQIRPLAEGQPWGVFYIQFETKRLPVVVLRRILRTLVPTSRRRDPNRPTWRMSDLLFICSQGEQDKRSISFAHFRQSQDGRLPELRTFSWDSKEDHFYYIKNLYLESLRWPENEDAIESWKVQWEKAFLAKHLYVIRSAQSLASELASMAATIRDLVMEIYSFEHVGGPLHQLYLSFKTVLIHDLSVEDFADMYAQTITYGLFSARATQEGDFAIQDVAGMIPNTNPFLKELLGELTTQEAVDLDELGVGQLVQLLQDVDIEAILRDFGRQKKGEDPVIHFYETFLKEYDAEKKVQRGVFYTPDPVVSFIVRSVDQILRTEFDCPDGLADTGTMEWKGNTVPKVQILDPATGTGTFLKYVIQSVWDTFYKKSQKISAGLRKEKWNKYVSEHLLPRLYGFELMMAPYTIAHMKLGLTLKQTGYDFNAGERLRVYLTNSLQPVHEIPRIDTFSLAHEAEEASSVKMDKSITVVIGNPPYSVHSSNKGEWITNLIKDYYQIDGQPLGERNPKALQDDYVKFQRFGQFLINQSGEGILAYITNHGYLDNITFRGMRHNLMELFSEIYILDLHGNANRRETTPEGEKDENVFDIQPGVAICFMIKKRNERGLARVYHSELFGIRSNKYEFLVKNDKNCMVWNQVKPKEPFYIFKPQDILLEPEYTQCRKITDFFEKFSPGIKTHRDNFVIDFDRSELYNRISIFRERNISDHEIKSRYHLKETKSWKIEQQRQQLYTEDRWKDYFTMCLYRPFDFRHYYHHNSVVDRPRNEAMDHFISKNNVGLICMRQVSMQNHYSHFFVSRYPVDNRVFYSNKGTMSFFPLHLFSQKQKNSFDKVTKFYYPQSRPNLSIKLIRNFESCLDLSFKLDRSGINVNTIESDDVFHYMYAIFHSPTYRNRYTEFLKIDFPRLPLTSNIDLFRSLCVLGADLVALHLMEDNYEAASWKQNGGISPFQHDITTFSLRSNRTTMGSFSKSKCYHDGRVYLDTSLGESSSYFEGVPEDVWNFHVGGYQVLYKWLYDRRGKKGQPGRTLSTDDIDHYQHIVVALKETIRIMDEIDVAIEVHGGWPIN